MAWVTPRTFVAAAVLTAAQLNETRDNLKALLPGDQVAFQTYTPTLTQSSTVTKTVTFARYTQIAKLVFVQVEVSATGTGTASNTVTLSLPVTAANNGLVGAFQQNLGGRIVDASGGPATFPAWTYLASTTTMALLNASNQILGGAGFTAALASGDTVQMNLVYEAA
jgi:hypothetical protein